MWICAASSADASDPQRFSVQGETLVFDTTLEIDGKARDINYDDVTVLRDLLRDHDGITRIELNSEGGGHYPSLEMAAIIVDFGLDTHVNNTCESSCVTVFLGGAKRSMSKGGRLGFHQLSWSGAAIEDYYVKNRDTRGWETPFDFASWLYADTQTETFTRLSYMIRRGVNPEFAIQTLRKPDASMWFPYRAVLMAAGVLRP